jgi:hypothetical protein
VPAADRRGACWRGVPELAVAVILMRRTGNAFARQISATGPDGRERFAGPGVWPAVSLAAALTEAVPMQQGGVPWQLLWSDPCRKPIAKVGFDQHASRRTAAGLGDAGLGNADPIIGDRFMGLISNPGRVSSPARCCLTRLIASRRPVLIRSPGFQGINDGATTAHSCPAPVNCRWPALIDPD